MTKILIDEAVVRQALEALTDRWQRHSDYYKELKNEVITALREVLVEQPAPPECKTEAEKTAFAFGWYKALESVREQKEPDPDELTIAYMSGLHEGKKRKPWVGLTDEEIVSLLPVTGHRPATTFARAIEAKLKERNT